MGNRCQLTNVMQYAPNSVAHIFLQRVGLQSYSNELVEVLRLFAVPGVESQGYNVHPLLIYADLLALGN